jgi:phosphatidylethanolamine/phosphatidyl-N-methylethanolamine N-methyltransferase
MPIPTPARDLPMAVTANAYRRWPSIYDAACGPLFRSAHRAAAEAANRIGGDVLEVGVGTGLVLPLYRRDIGVTGVDLSEDMLAKARVRLGREHLPQVVALEAGDIHTLRHPAESYDAIVLPFVLTLLARPEAALDNCRRMLRPGGEIIVVSHFRSERDAVAAFEQWIAPRIARLGLRPDFPLSRIVAWAAATADMEIVDARPIRPLRVFSLLRIARRARPH